MNIPTSLLLDGKVYVPEAEFNELQAMLAAANRDRDTALSIARGYHDQWAEADRELAAAREDQDGWEAGLQTGYEKGLEDAARVVTDYDWGGGTQDIAAAIRALSLLPAPSAAAVDPVAAGGQTQASTSALSALSRSQARLPGLRDQPIEW